MTNILTFFSTRTLLQIAFILASAAAMKAWSLGLLFGGIGERWATAPLPPPPCSHSHWSGYSRTQPSITYVTACIVP